jgi:hypothetical protein
MLQSVCGDCRHDNVAAIPGVAGNGKGPGLRGALVLVVLICGLRAEWKQTKQGNDGEKISVHSHSLSGHMPFRSILFE